MDDKINLFIKGNFNLHSGSKSNFKIECDTLTEEDWKTIAYIIADRHNFRFVKGVPTGGIKLQNALLEYRNSESNGFLIVDDVLTTGGSMEEVREQVEMAYPNCLVYGVVLFARDKCPDWIVSVFQMW